MDTESDAKKTLQQQLRMSNQARRSLAIQNSLSTITEEPKSLPTTLTSIDSKQIRSEETTSTSAGSASKIWHTSRDFKKTPLPQLPKLIQPRKQYHTSKVLRSSSREFIVPHQRDFPRTPSLQENLLTHISTNDKPLFPKVVDDIDKRPESTSILVTGFGLKNLSSLQDALRAEEGYQLKNQYKSKSEICLETVKSSLECTVETQTGVEERVRSQQIEYMLGCIRTNKEVDEEAGEEEEEKEEEPLWYSKERVNVSEQEIPTVLSKNMRKAQKYLRVHHIFQFFQFIIAHLLSALPDNPIEFILQLLDKCLIFRSSFIDPPLLFERKHLSCLVNLMDRMHTGFIDFDQYKTGMRTIGLRTYDEMPPRNKDGMIRKEFFIEEAYDGLTHLLLEMIRCRYIVLDPPIIPQPPSTSQLTSEETLGSNNICCIPSKAKFKLK